MRGRVPEKEQMKFARSESSALEAAVQAAREKALGGCRAEGLFI